jgi:hypothetical protein
LDKYGPQMKGWAKSAVKYGNEAHVDPDMVLAMALTNMKVDPFKEVISKYPDEFPKGERAVGDLIGNDDLALKVSAYNLKMLEEGAASHAKPKVRARGPLDQFLGSGYNAGGTLGRSLDVATGHTAFLPNEVEHGESTVNVVAAADQILYGSGAYK